MSKRWTEKDIENLQAKKGKAVLPSVSANSLTRHALRVFDLRGFHCWRQNNGGVYDPTRKVFRANSSTPGISDIIGFHRQTGQFLACEIKAGKDKLSDDQKAFLERVERAGGVAVVVRTVEDLETISKKFK